MTHRFTTIIIKEGKWYISRCVELGVVSQGKTIEDSQKNLKEAVELYLEDLPKRKRYFLNREAPLITSFELKHA